MLEKSTLSEILTHIVKHDVKITDNSICGDCSRCGECCTNFLPVSQSDIDRLSKYVIENKIRPQKQMLIMQQRLTCPYYDGKKCLVYEVRPMICKEFYCYKKPTGEMAKKFENEKMVTVNMWELATAIDKYIRR